MSNGTGTGTATQQALLHIAAREAQGAHLDTGKILAMLLEGVEEVDPIGAIIDSQDRGAERLELIIRMLRDIRADVRDLKANSEVMMAETATLRTQLDDVYAKLADVTLGQTSAAQSPR